MPPLPKSTPYSGAAKTLREYGYTLDDDDFYNAGSFPDSTIQDILAGQDLSEAVAASIEGGFPSDINARGDIMLLLLTLENKDVVTVFTRDGKAELCFIQRISSGEIMPLTKE